MHPDDLAALGVLETEIEKWTQNGRSLSGPFVPRIPWLVRLVKQLNSRVEELEAGGIPEHIAKKDVEIAARDAQLAQAAAKVAELEKLKLPDPNEEFRRREPRENHPQKPAENSDSSLSPAEPIATRDRRRENVR